MSTAQLAAVSYVARYSGHTHALYAYQVRKWFSWCELHRLDPLVGVQRAHVELYIRQLGDRGLMESSRRDPARAPRAAPGRQGQQARHHAHTVPVLRVLEACRGERTTSR